jgi:hypothetical protein
MSCVLDEIVRVCVCVRACMCVLCACVRACENYRVHFVCMYIVLANLGLDATVCAISLRAITGLVDF